MDWLKIKNGGPIIIDDSVEHGTSLTQSLYIPLYWTCADPESLARGGPNLTIFFMRGERIQIAGHHWLASKEHFTVKAPNIAHLSLLTSFGYYKKKQN